MVTNIWKKIKMLLYIKGYINIDNIHNKIEYLISKDIDIYKSNLTSLKIKVISKDITESYIILNNFNKTDIENDIIYMPNINSNLVKTIRFINWYANDGILIDKDKFKLWLLEVDKFIYKCEKSKNNNSGKVYGNFNKIKPYYYLLLETIPLIFNHVVNIDK